MSGQANPPVISIPIGISNVAKSGSEVTIVFDQPVSLKGVPAYTTDFAGVTATAAVLTTPTMMTLTFSAPITTATSLIVPFEEPAIRNASGGFVNSGTFPL